MCQAAKHFQDCHSICSEDILHPILFQTILHKHPPASSFVLCRLVNRSGLRLSYWADSGEGAEPAEPGSSYTLNAWEESPLMVEPLEKTVILPDAQQQVRHKATGQGPSQCGAAAPAS